MTPELLMPRSWLNVTSLLLLSVLKLYMPVAGPAGDIDFMPCMPFAVAAGLVVAAWASPAQDVASVTPATVIAPAATVAAVIRSLLRLLLLIKLCLLYTSPSPR